MPSVSLQQSDEKNSRLWNVKKNSKHTKESSMVTKELNKVSPLITRVRAGLRQEKPWPLAGSRCGGPEGGGPCCPARPPSEVQTGRPCCQAQALFESEWPLPHRHTAKKSIHYSYHRPHHSASLTLGDNVCSLCSNGKSGFPLPNIHL